MSVQTGNIRVEEVNVMAVVTRADGRVEDLGVIAKYRRPWYRTFWVRVNQFFGKEL